MRKGIFSILIPVFNEEANMQRLEEQIDAFIKKSPVTTEVLIVNDGSTDNSQSRIEEMAEKYPWCNYIVLEKNRGLSGALLAGISVVDTEWIGYIDSDLQTHPDDFLKLLPFVNEYEMVTGIRAERKDSFVKKISSRIANQIRRWMINDGVSDTGCPLKIMGYQTAKTTPSLKGMHRFWPAIVQVVPLPRPATINTIENATEG